MFLQSHWMLRRVGRVLQESIHLDNISNTQLSQEAIKIRAQHDNGKLKGKHNGKQASSVVRILALGVQAIKRVHGFRLHPVQIQAAVAAAQGKTIEMQTGEGKTVVSALIAYFYSHLGHVHLATTSPYLAQRDYESVEPVFRILNCNSGVILQQQKPAEKRAVYQSHITYGPGYQFGFDYLTDQTTLRKNDSGKLGMSTVMGLFEMGLSDMLLQQGEFNTLIVDEADSVLIDEALTPLVLSGAQNKGHDPRPYLLACQVANSLKQDHDYVALPQKKAVRLTMEGMKNAHQKMAVNSRHFELARPWSRYIENALHARHFMIRNEHYVVEDGEVKIVDQMTGRIFSDRQWQAGLHQAVCARETVTIQPPNQAIAQISRQKYFLRYDRIIGLSGTLGSIKRELKRVYNATIQVIPKNKKCLREWLPTRFFKDTDSKLKAIAIETRSRHQTGQPILIGTRTIDQSFRCNQALQDFGLEATILNGIQDEDEAAIVSQAGQFGKITIATNMAGRGTDIKPDEESIQRGGLHVIGYEHNFSRRVDRQLIGRSARQGQPGSAQFFQACDDDLLLDFPSFAKRIAQFADSTGECRCPRASGFIDAIQRTIETKSETQRSRLMEAESWKDLVRETIASDTVAS